MNAVNEFEFIARLREQASTRKHSTRLVKGIGDDASTIRQVANRDLIVTTDLLVEGVDFHRRPPHTPAADSRLARTVVSVWVVFPPPPPPPPAAPPRAQSARGLALRHSGNG